MVHTDQELPFSEACERNKGPILDVLRGYKLTGSVLEIGHGTGQHAVAFSSELALEWHPTDVSSYNWMMTERLALQSEKIKAFCQPPKALEVGSLPLKEQLPRTFTHAFTANTLHIMSAALAQKFCQEIGVLVEENGFLFLYGPFKFRGQFTSESNGEFDHSLKSRDPLSGIRDFESVEKWLSNQFSFLARHPMPAFNECLVFLKKGVL